MTKRNGDDIASLPVSGIRSPFVFALGTSRPVAALRHLLLFLRRSSTYLGDDTLLTQTVLGDLVFLDTNDTSLLPSLIKRGYWEPAVTLALLRTVRPGDRVVEVGAHVGYHTLLLASRVGASGSVIAFEPHPRSCALLRQTLAANERGQHVRVVPLAVTNRPGVVTLHRLVRHQGSSSLHAFSSDWLAESDDVASPIEVEATSIDAFFGDSEPPPHLIKIDAEGAEPAIIAGMSRLLARASEVRLMIEFFPAALKRGDHDPRAFLASLVAMGFQLRTIEAGGRLVRRSIDELLSVGQAELYLAR